VDIPRVIGYVIATLIIILGIVVLPYGIVLIFAAILMIWAVYTGGKKKKSQGFSEDRRPNRKRCVIKA
jgi:hypothetical protein